MGSSIFFSHPTPSQAAKEGFRGARGGPSAAPLQLAFERMPKPQASTASGFFFTPKFELPRLELRPFVALNPTPYSLTCNFPPLLGDVASAHSRPSNLMSIGGIGFRGSEEVPVVFHRGLLGLISVESTPKLTFKY